MLAIVGYGDHVKRNIVPALSAMGKRVGYVVVPTKDRVVAFPEAIVGHDFAEAVADHSVSAVYIATPIASHFTYVEAAIRAGKPVLCEKPLTANLRDTTALIELASKEGVKLQEVVMYQYHRQFRWIQEFMSQEQYGQLRKVHACFQIPHLSENNIRYSQEKGGGALLDLGFYPLSMITSLLGAPRNASSSVLGQQGYSVNLSGAALLNYDRCYGLAEWGIGRIYRNEVVLEFEDKQVTLERAFSKPGTMRTNARIDMADGETSVTEIPADDHFERLFNDFLDSKELDSQHLDSILMRAKIMHDLQ